MMTRTEIVRLMHVQSVLPEKDVMALKRKTGELFIKDALSKAVYHYLSCKNNK
ncbi:MAG TPA: DUF5371 domain-containing protein [Candidatus Methanoperedenaceae archaeon]|nr:DUF5371 domain-containing protein [Candidatus Methanoperedenaceae archaeon]